MENYVEAIIELTYSQYPLDFKEIYPNEFPDELSMREKKQLFKICLKRYQELTKINIDKVWGHFSNIVEKRNHLAHWSVDTTESGLSILSTSNRIRFVNFKRMKIIDEVLFNSKTSFLLEEKIKSLTMDVIEIFKYFRDKKER